jgi:hypothetical protein
MKIKMMISVSAVFTLILLLAQCSNSQQERTDMSDEEQKAFTDKGQAIVASAFTELSNRLKGAIEEKGVSGALEYCSLVALPLVDSLSVTHNAMIRRTSLKIRNPKDEPLDWERTVLTGFETAVQQKQELKPVVKQLDEHTVAFAAPIRMLPLCLKCHGIVGKDIAEGDYSKITELYPQDAAVNYKEGDLRGMWSITFKR